MKLIWKKINAGRYETECGTFFTDYNSVGIRRGKWVLYKVVNRSAREVGVWDNPPTFEEINGKLRRYESI